MSSEQSRTISLYLSDGQVCDAFTSLLLMTGHLHDGEVITDISVDDSLPGKLRGLEVTIKKEPTG